MKIDEGIMLDTNKISIRGLVAKYLYIETNAAGWKRMMIPTITAKITFIRTAPAAASFEIFPNSVYFSLARFTAFSIAVFTISDEITLPLVSTSNANSGLVSSNQSVKHRIENI